jgi:general secretion pathway protein K
MKIVRKDEKGIALFIVLWVLTLLTVIVGEFCHAMRSELNITRNFKEEVQAYYLAYAGMNRAVFELASGGSGAPISASQEAEGSEAGPVQWRVNANKRLLPYGVGTYKIHIENLSGRININRAGPNMLHMVLESFVEDPDKRQVIVDSILDWRDPDDLHRLNGAETDYYESLSPPYEAGNDFFFTAEELLLVRGVTADLFYGGLRDLITVYPPVHPSELKSYSHLHPVLQKEREKNKHDYNKININSASLSLLRTIPGMTEELVPSISEYRSKQNFNTLYAIKGLEGGEIYGKVAPYLTVKELPEFFVESYAKLNNSETRYGIRALVRIDPKAKARFRFVQLWDGIAEPARQREES